MPKPAQLPEDSPSVSPTSTYVDGDLPMKMPLQVVWPAKKANLISRLFFIWVSPILKVGSKRPLEENDLWKLPDECLTRNVAATMQQNYDNLLNEKRPQVALDAGSEDTPLLSNTPLEKQSRYILAWAVYRSFKKDVWQVILCLGLAKLFYVLAPICTSHVVAVVASPVSLPDSARHTYEGVAWSFALFVAQMIGLILYQQSGYIGKATHVWTKGGLIEMISRKSMKLSQKARITMTDGRINTMITSDTLPAAWGIIPLAEAVTIPFVIIMGFTLVINTLGYSALVGLTIMILSSPLQMSMQIKYKKAQRVASDTRVNTISDTIKYFTAVRFSGYERLFAKKIREQRKVETNLQEKFLGRQADSKAVMTFLPILATSISLVIYKLTGHPLDATVIFTSIHYFVVIRNYGLAPMPKAFAGLTDAFIALGRITELLQAEELVHTRLESLDSSLAIDVKADFAYKTLGLNEDAFSLKNINLKVPKGSLVCILGRVGTGKSSLLYSLMNEIEHTKGHLHVNGKVSYVPQLGWIQSGTIVENITWSNHTDAIDMSRVQKVIDSCALREDVNAWQDHEYTKVGERGITISGGQRQRICLARAAYAESEIVLLDDPLAAVDPHVGQQLLRDCILAGPLAGRTRLLVTHALDVLPHADMIVVMDRDEHGNGCIVQTGTYNDLRNQPGTLQTLLSNYMSKEQKKNSKNSKNPEEQDALVDLTNEDTTVKEIPLPQEVFTKEDRRVGAVESDTYAGYIKAVKSWPLLTVVAFMLIIHVAAFNVNSLFLGAWVRGRFVKLSQEEYIMIYMGIGVFYAVTFWLAIRLLSKAALRASFNIFEQALFGVFHSPLSWHVQTPNGRILNRFTEDVRTMDSSLASTWFDPLVKIINIIGLGIILAFVQPGSIIMFLLFFSYAAFLGGYYRKSLREAKRLGSTLLSDVYSSFAEQLAGLAVVRAFNQQERCIERLQDAMDIQHAAYLLKPSMVCWVTVRLSSMWILLAMCIYAVVFRDSVNSAEFGALLSLAIQSGNNISTTITLLADLEGEMNKVERILHFANLPKEGEAILPDDPQEHEIWPTHGQVEFKNVKMRYRPDLPVILKGISFTVKPGEKAAIIGRSGAGKSSLSQALFRTTDIEGGSICIDGKDIRELGLQTLRERISTIPQEAFLFTGTVRENIDPEGKATDLHLHDILNLVQKSSNVSASLKAKLALDAPVHAEGANFSAGERQLLALLRAIVKGSKVMMMDEATSSVDPETDGLIQKLIQTELVDTTLLSIAHRLHTVAYYDKIIVMEAGEIVEMGKPMELSVYQKSHFRRLCESKGITEQELFQIRQDAGLY